MADISKLKVPAGSNGALVEYDVKDATARSSIPAASSSLPQGPGTAAVGTSTDYARADHVHQGYSNATTTTAGLMSAADKSKLDGVSSIVISDTEPTDPDPTIWIDPESLSTERILMETDLPGFSGVSMTVVKTVIRTI